MSPARAPENISARSAANTSSARLPAKQLPGSTRANRLREVKSTRFLGDPEGLERAGGRIGAALAAEEAEALGLVTASYDEVDWDDEIRLALEERASFSADALTGLEANLRFPGPETMETRIFARLSAWQNWIFQRPNATGEEGALKRYGTGLRPRFDPERV